MFALTDIEFAHKFFLYFLVLIPAMALWYWYKFRKNSQPEIKMSSTKAFGMYRSNFKLYFNHAAFVMRLLAMVLFIIALARPQSKLTSRDITVEGIDIMIALDISGSMLAEDFKPNRMEAAKNMAIEFVRSRPNDRIGLTVFSGESFTQCPLTTDHTVLINLAEEVHTNMVRDGTAIGDGLATSINRLRTSTAISKVIILLTDGVNNMGMIDPLTAAQIAAKFGIRVYTIGVGSSGPVPYPFQTARGVVYQNVEIPVDEPLLEEIAQITDGKYFWANTQNKLEQIYEEINELEKTKIDVTEFKSNKDEFFPFVLLGLIFLIIEFLIRNIYLRSIP